MSSRWVLPLVCVLAAAAGVAGWRLLSSASNDPDAAADGAGGPGGRSRPARAGGRPPRTPPPVVDAAATDGTAKDSVRVAREQAAMLVVEAGRLSGAEQAARLESAFDLLDRVERAEPGNHEVPFWRGLAAVLANDRDVAERALARLQVLSPLGERDPRIHYLVCVTLLAFEPEKADVALKAARRARALDATFMPQPVLLATYRALSLTAAKLVTQRSPDYAVQYLRDAVTIAKLLGNEADALVARRSLAIAYQRASRWVEATEAWEGLAKDGPGVADFEFGLANAYSAQNRWEEAAAHFTKVLDLVAAGRAPPDQVHLLQESRLRRGNCHRLLERPAEALADLEAYVKESPEDGRGHYWVGMVHFDSRDDPEAALPHLREARRLMPYCEEPLRALLRVYDVALPDEAKAAELRKELEEGAEARKKERERVAKERPEGWIGLCE